MTRNGCVKMINETMLQGFEWYLPADGKHWQRLSRMAHWLAFRGFTAVWLPPAYKGDQGDREVGYAVYDLYDLGEFNQKGTVRTKYGTAEEYIDCVSALKRVGIKPVADVVLNHRIGGDEAEPIRAHINDPNNRLQVEDSEKEIVCKTRFTFPGGGTKRMEVGKRFAGKTFHCVIGEQQAVTIDENGWGEFAVRGGGCSVYVPRVGLFLRIRHLFKDVKRFFRVS